MIFVHLMHVRYSLLPFLCVWFKKTIFQYVTPSVFTRVKRQMFCCRLCPASRPSVCLEISRLSTEAFYWVLQQRWPPAAAGSSPTQKRLGGQRRHRAWRLLRIRPSSVPCALMHYTAGYSQWDSQETEYNRIQNQRSQHPIRPHTFQYILLLFDC